MFLLFSFSRAIADKQLMTQAFGSNKARIKALAECL